MEIVKFERGGHYAFLKHADIVNAKIENLLNKVTIGNYEIEKENAAMFFDSNEKRNEAVSQELKQKIKI